MRRLLHQQNGAGAQIQQEGGFRLNLTVKQEKYLLPTVEEIMPRLAGSKVFTPLDATSSFYQIPLPACRQQDAHHFYH